MTRLASDRYVESTQYDDIYRMLKVEPRPSGTFDLDGVSHADAPIPSRRHTCWVQTYGLTGLFTLVERCACGAIRLDGRGPWVERNTRDRGSSKGEPKVGRRRFWRRRSNLTA